MKDTLISTLKGLHLRVPDLLKEYCVPGISYAVYVKDEVYPFSVGYLNAQMRQKVDDNSLFHACSMSKLVTSLIVLKLVDERLLDLDTPVNHYLKDWTLDFHKAHIHTDSGMYDQEVTLSHLLNHSSGILDHAKAFGPLTDLDKVPSLSDIVLGKTPYNPQPIQIETSVGAAFAYSDAGFCVIEKILCDVTRKSFNELAQTFIFDPLLLTRSCFKHANEFDQGQVSRGTEEKPFNVAYGHNKAGELIPQRRATYPYLAGAGLWTTAKELSQLLVSISDAIKGKGALGISSTLMGRMIQPEGPEDWAGLGVFVQKEDTRIQIFSMGWGLGFQCKLISHLTQEYGIVVLTNSDPGCDQDKALTGKLIQLIKKEMNSLT